MQIGLMKCKKMYEGRLMKSPKIQRRNNRREYEGKKEE